MYKSRGELLMALGRQVAKSKGDSVTKNKQHNEKVTQVDDTWLLSPVASYLSSPAPSITSTMADIDMELSLKDDEPYLPSEAPAARPKSFITEMTLFPFQSSPQGSSPKKPDAVTSNLPSTDEQIFNINDKSPAPSIISDISDAQSRNPGLLLVPYSETEGSANDSPVKLPKVTKGTAFGLIKSPRKERQSRARSRNPEEWKCNKRKRARERGESYENGKKKIIPAKKVKIACDKCKMECNLKVSRDQRQIIFRDYYALSNFDKRQFLLTHSERKIAARHETDKPRKTYTYKYFLPVDAVKINVCKKMFLSTLSISPTCVYTAWNNATESVTPEPLKWGKHKKKVNPEEEKKLIREHIESFPKIESHYCRAKTSKQYLDPRLSIAEMYRLYKTKCSEENREACLESAYRYIFTHEYNLDFHKPKSDLCGTCKAFDVAVEVGKVGNDERTAQQHHLAEKVEMRRLRNEEREKPQEKKVTVSFDLENVIALPLSNVGEVFFKTKLNCYNLTASATTLTILDKKKIKVTKGYMCVWYEGLSGRTGNDIASAVNKILNKVLLDFPTTNIISTWSDSCVPQNRNSYMSMAIAKFLENHPQVDKITMHYSIPGHSAVQEVDSMHSGLERTFKVNEIWSPITLMRVLIQYGRRNDSHLLQMQPQDFLDYQRYAEQFNYSFVPFTQVVTLEFIKGDPRKIRYKTSYRQEEFYEHSLVQKGQKRIETNPINWPEIILPYSTNVQKINDRKIKDISSLFKYMENHPADLSFYKNLFSRKLTFEDQKKKGQIKGQKKKKITK